VLTRPSAKALASSAEHGELRGILLAEHSDTAGGAVARTGYGLSIFSIYRNQSS
jgi:hypothetical protein